MTAQNTKVTYKAVANFTDLHKDVDSLIAKIEALQKAEKDLNKVQRQRPDKGNGRSSATSKSAEANENRRIKRLDAAQKATETADKRSERGKDQAQRRRHKKAMQLFAAQDLQLAKEKRAEKGKDKAQDRRNRKADQQLKVETAESNRRIKAEDSAQARRNRNQKAADDNKNIRDKGRARMAVKLDEARQKQRIADDEAAAREMHAEDLAWTKRIEREKDEAQRAKFQKQRQQASELAKEDKQRAIQLERDILKARSQLEAANQKAEDGNLFTKNKVQTKNVGQVKVDFDADRDRNYYEAVARARALELQQIKDTNVELDREINSRGRLYNLLAKIPGASRRAEDSTSRSFRSSSRDIGTANALLSNFRKNLDQIGRWRPRLIPPFIALIPIIGGILGLMNPLIAGMGALSGVVIGLAGSIGSLAGAAIGAIPALSALLAVGAALKMSFGGIGKALDAANKAAAGGAGTGGSGGGSAPQQEELTQVEKIQRAQERYRRTIEDVKDAAEALDDAKKKYNDRLKETAKRLDDVRKSEARLAANAQLATENYWDVMADPGSTKGEKMDALVKMDEAKDEMANLKKESADLKKELADLKKTGVNGDKAVRDAARRLTDATWAQRDAQIDLANAYKDTGKAASAAASGGGGVDAFQEAMDKLSPSAQKVVLSLLAMKGAWEAVQRSVQERYFANLVDDIQLLTRLFPPLENMLGATADALGRVASKGLRLVSSDAWLKDINDSAAITVPMVENVGDGLLSILNIFRDLTMAAGPFSVAMSEGFAEGAKNFETMVAGARESGSLAAWLETVGERMSQWWRIVKNVGKTIFNYSSAASEFGQWLTDGLENLTESWVAASEAAKAEDSPFKQWLEDSKIVLDEMKDLVGTFFGWLAEESADKDNIESFARILDTITNELGPALARIFDVMQESGVGESLLDAIVQIVETLATLLENGGAEGIKSFFETINELFGFMAEAIENTDPDVIEGVSKALMTIAALRFFGVTSFLGAISSFVLPKSLKELQKILDKTDKVGKEPKPSKAPKGGGFKGVLKGAKGVAGRAGLIGAGIAGVIGMTEDGLPIVANTFNGTYANDPKQGASDSLKNTAKWSMPGIGIGIDLIEMLFPGWGKSIDDWLTGVSDTIVNWVTDIPNKVAESGAYIWDGLRSLNDWLVDTWDGAVEWIVDTPNRIAREMGEIWGHLQNFRDWLVTQWDNAVTWFQEDLPAAIVNLGVNIWTGLVNFKDWLITTWDNAVTWFQEDLPTAVANLGVNIWTGLVGFKKWLSSQWDNAVIWFQEDLPTEVAKLGINIWTGMTGIGDWLAEQGNALKDWFINLPGEIGKFFGGLGDSFEGGRSSTRNEKYSLAGFQGGVGGGGKGGISAAARGGGPKDKNASGGVWATVIGSPVAWLDTQWASVGEWFTTKGAELTQLVTGISGGVSAAWGSLGAAVARISTDVIDPAVRGVGDTMKWLHTNVVMPVWNGIKNTISETWNRGIRPVIDTLTRVIRTDPKRAFEEARDAIGTAWKGIESLAKAPVKFVVDVVLNGLISAINTVLPKSAKLPKVALPKGFHDGGHTGNANTRDVTGVVHGDEHVIRATSRRKIEMSNPGLLDHMNTYGQVPGYRKGGLVNPLPSGSYSVSQPYHANHNGIDLAAPMGTKVYAAGSGTVQMAQSVPMGGNEVYVQHENGLGTRYSHLSRFASRPGQKVKAGNVIGYVGSTGMSTGPHLHYMVHAPGKGPGNYTAHRNPAPFMGIAGKDLGEADGAAGVFGGLGALASKLMSGIPGVKPWVTIAGELASRAAGAMAKSFGPDAGMDGPDAKLYDRGGVLPHGGVGVNLSGKPEAILTNAQWQNMDRIQGLLTNAFSGVGGSSFGSTFSSFDGSGLSTGMQSTSTDNSITIEKVEVNNPIGETTEESIANTIRDLTYVRGS